MKKFVWLILTLAVILLVILVQGKPLFENGVYDPGKGLIFRDGVIFRDSLVHLSLINEISTRFPPTNFSAGGIPLKNYHYLYDAALALIQKIVPINPLDLYFRVMPVILSTLLAITLYLTVFKLTKNRFFATLGIFFTIFATSFGVLMPAVKIFFHARTVTGGNNMFMTDQILNMLINPQGVLSLIVFLGLFLLVEKYCRKGRAIYLVFFSLLLGVSFGIKAYGGIIFAASALGFSVYYFVIKRDVLPFLASIFGLLLIAAWFFQTIDGKVAGIAYAPLWLLDVMYNDLDRLNEPNFVYMKNLYITLGSWHNVLRLTLEQFIVYVVGSLGLRLLGLIGLFHMVKKLRNISPAWVFLLIGAALSFSLPLVFNQTSKAYDIVQFTPYFSLFMGIMFTYTLFLLHKKMRNQTASVIIIGALVFVFFLLNQRELGERIRINSDEIVFSPVELQAIEFVKTQTPRDAVFLLPVTGFNDDYLWLPGLAGRRTFYSGERFASQVGVNVKAKKDAILNFDPSLPCALPFDYIYTKKSEIGKFDRIKSACQTKTAFENNEIIVLYHHN